MEPLTVEGIEEAIPKLVENARQLLEEAGILFEAGHYPRVVALAQFAYEELGKVAILLGVGTQLWAGKSVDWKDVGHTLKDHPTKTAIMDALVWHGVPGLTFDEFVYTSKYTAKMSNNLKNAALYVGLERGNSTLPSDYFTKDYAQGLLFDVRSSLDRYKWTVDKDYFSIERVAAIPGIKAFWELSEDERLKRMATEHESLARKREATEEALSLPWLEEYRKHKSETDRGQS